MKATEQYFPVVLFIMLYKVVLTFDYVEEILTRDHSNKINKAVLSSGTVCFSLFFKMKFGIFMNFDFGFSWQVEHLHFMPHLF